MDESNAIPTDAGTLAALLGALSDGGEVSLWVSGESMVPFYRHGRTVVTLRRECGRMLKRGDAVFFLRADGTPILHRVVAVGRDALTVGGDGQRWVETVALAQILARVVRVRRTPASREVSVERWWYRWAVRLWAMGRWWHPRVAKWIRKGGRDRYGGL